MYRIICVSIFISSERLISEFYFVCVQAYETAASLDVTKIKNDPPLLYGVPISVKECFAVKGCWSTGGLACRLGPNKRMEHDCLTVEVLRKAGALPLCTANTIQLMMLNEW